MARPPQDAIETFMSITGATEAVALLKLEEHNGDLNAAVNAHFSEGDQVNLRASALPDSHDDFIDVDDPMDVEPTRPHFPLLSARPNPFSLLDPNFGQSLFDGRGSSELTSHAPWVSHPREVREVPIKFKDGSSQSGYSAPTIEDVTGSTMQLGQEVHGTVVIDDDDELPVPPAAIERTDDEVRVRHPVPSAPRIADMTDSNNDIEEEMIRAAIEASKQEAEGNPVHESGVSDQVSSGPQFDPKRPALEDAQLAHAVSLSLQAAEQERVLHEQGVQIVKGSSSSSVVNPNNDQGRMATSNGRQGFPQMNSGTSSRSYSDEEEAEDAEEQPLVRNRSRPFPTGTADPEAEDGQLVDSPPSHPVAQNSNGDMFHSDEWGGISSEEHDEAVMLEAAMFGGIPERTAYHYPYPPQTGPGRYSSAYPQVPRPLSPTLEAQRLLREQQDGEYLASLQADREKELKVMQEAELRRIEEAAAREAALEEEKQQKEEALRKLQEEEEFERHLTAKEASLPQEPALNDDSAVTLLIRMPDGSRCGRRFLRSDKFQSLIDFIDTRRVVRPGSYRLVRPYPRHAFGEAENEQSLSQLGLTSKQEALFLELI